MEGKDPFASILKGDLKTALAGGEKAILELAMATHACVTSEEFNTIVRDWLKTAVIRKLEKRSPPWSISRCSNSSLSSRHDFKTFIVSGGGIDFIRVFAEETYGIPPEQVIGSSIKAKYELRDGKPAIVKMPDLDFIDDGPGKPVGIHQHIGRAHRRFRKFRRRLRDARMDHQR